VRGFRAAGRWYVAGLGPTEREVFATVVADVAELLGAERFGVSDDAGEADASGPLGRLRMSTGDVDAPEDPAVRRLLPDASRGDDAVAAEFRRLTEADLRAAKVGRLRDVWTLLLDPGAGDPHDAGRGGRRGRRSRPRWAVDDDDDLLLEREDAPAFAAALTDIRLVLAERLGLRTEEDADRLYATLEAQAAEEEDADELGLGGGRADDDRPAREILEREVRAYLGSVYAALSWLQESLMAVLLDDLGRAADGRRTDRD
jgi:hypothetical protein